MFRQFSYIDNYDYSSGWDRYALDYAKLLTPETVYYLTKEIIHHLVDEACEDQGRQDFTVLDVNCGTGNDFPFFLGRGWNIVGIDGSAGMLNKSAEKYEDGISSGKVKLFEGLIETLDDSDFKGHRFDLIFSVTGGFSYVNDEQLQRINRQLSRLLKPDGKIVLAHLNRFCLPEFMYRLVKGNNPFLRKSSSLKVSIKGEEHTMYLRGPRKLYDVYSRSFRNIQLLPLLAFTPPYQTGFNPSPKTLNRLKRWELKLLQGPFTTYWADQVVVVGESHG